MFSAQQNDTRGRPHRVRFAIDPALLEAEMHAPPGGPREVALIGSRTPSGTLEISEPICEKSTPCHERAASAAERAARKAFFQEFKRRRTCQITLGYSVVAWVVLQLLSIVCPALGFPDWAMKVTLGLLVMGFAIALVMGWILECSFRRGRASAPTQPEFYP